MLTEATAKKILLITYYWPPFAGGGVQRWLKFVKYLPAFGWEAVVYTPENPSFDLKDPGLLSEIPKNTEVLKIPIWEPYSLLHKKKNTKVDNSGQSERAGLKNNLIRWLRGNLFIPDPRIFWKKPSLDFLPEIIKTNDIEWIVSTGPPHSMHLIARDLKRKCGKPWIADFRDPWSRWDLLKGFMPGFYARWRHKKLEESVLKEADLVLTVSKAWAKEFRALGAHRVEVIPNGFDEEDFNNWKLTLPPRKNEKWVISHFGLFNAMRYVEAFWEALDQSCAPGASLNGKIEIRLGGLIEESVRRKLEKLLHISKHIRWFPYLDHQAVKNQYREAHILLMFSNQSENSTGHLPGKLFEYLASRRRIIAFGTQGGDLAQMISQCEAGDTFAFHHGALAKTLIEEIITGKKELLLPDSQNYLQYSRRKLTQQLAGFLNEAP